MPRLFIEQAIRYQFGADSLFLTALGTVFNIDEFEYAEEVNQLMLKYDVIDLYIVNDFSCTFIQNVLNEGVKYNTEAEKTLFTLVQKTRMGLSQLMIKK